MISSTKYTKLLVDEINGLETIARKYRYKSKRAKEGYASYAETMDKLARLTAAWLLLDDAGKAIVPEVCLCSIYCANSTDNQSGKVFGKSKCDCWCHEKESQSQN